MPESESRRVLAILDRRAGMESLAQSRLCDLLGPENKFFDELLITNPCLRLPKLVKDVTIPDRDWLSKNVLSLHPFKLLLSCGKISQWVYRLSDAKTARIIEIPHPADKQWTRKGLRAASLFIQEGKRDLSITFRGNTIAAQDLIPF